MVTGLKWEKAGDVFTDKTGKQVVVIHDESGCDDCIYNLSSRVEDCNPVRGYSGEVGCSEAKVIFKEA